MNSLKQFFNKLTRLDRCPIILAQSFCIGTYIAFSPFVGAHTIMVFLFSWLLNLNIPVMFAASCGINNPVTAVPVYLCDYTFGYWLVHSVLGIEDLANPWWLRFLEQWCAQYITDLKFCLWSFLIGGNLLGVFLAIALYPIIKRYFVATLQKLPSSQSTGLP